MSRNDFENSNAMY